MVDVGGCDCVWLSGEWGDSSFEAVFSSGTVCGGSRGPVGGISTRISVLLSTGGGLMSMKESPGDRSEEAHSSTPEDV